MSGAGAITLGSVSFGPAHSLRVDVEDSMAASIIRLEQENEELRAEVALLREEQKILAERFDARLHGAGITAEANAAVIEGGTGETGAERPEPSHHFEDDGFESIVDKEAADRIGGNPWSAW